MDQQCIEQTFNSHWAVTALQVLLAESCSVTRTDIARRVWEQFRFTDSLGNRQLAICQ